MDKIKLLIVDDSVLFREILSGYLRRDGTIEVVDKVSDANAARDAIQKFRPDVMTLDLDIPRLDCADFLRKTLPQLYVPTIVVSGSPENQNKCLQAGAVDVISKPAARANKDIEIYSEKLALLVRKVFRKAHPKMDAGGEPQNLSNSTDSNTPKPRTYPTITPVSRNSVSPRMDDMIRAAAEMTAQARETISQRTKHLSNVSGVNLLPEAPKNSYVAASNNHPKLSRKEAVIALGASTGGTEALEQVIREFPNDTPPVVIVQHMPAGFTKLYAERLNRSCKMQVKEAEDGDRLRRGLIIIGAGDFHLRVCKDSSGYYVSSKPGERISGHCPSVDALFNSVATTVGEHAIGALLTGMGRDGADGLLRMREAGAFTIGQDKESCVVYGMPMEAYKIGAVQVQAPLDKIAEIILGCLI